MKLAAELFLAPMIESVYAAMSVPAVAVIVKVRVYFFLIQVVAAFYCLRAYLEDFLVVRLRREYRRLGRKVLFFIFKIIEYLKNNSQNPEVDDIESGFEVWPGVGV